MAASIFKRLSGLITPLQLRTGALDPREEQSRRIAITLALVIGAPLVLLVYFKLMFPGLVNPDAMDFAQLGRNIAHGHGFVTYFIRPLASDQGPNPIRQPELVHGPLYPFLLAVAFAVFGAKDTVAGAVSGLCFLLTIPLIYRMGSRLFNPAIAILASLAYLFNALMLEYAASGLHISLYVLLTTWLLTVVYDVAVYARDKASPVATRRPVTLPIWRLAVLGMVTALLYLDEPVFFWLLPVLAGTVLWLCWPERTKALIAFLIPIVVLAGPVMVRNMALTGDPAFALKGTEVWMYTKDFYPGDVAYRLTHAEIIPGIGVFKAVVQKIMLGAGTVIDSFPEISASWLLAFFLPGLLFQFRDPAVNTVRRVMICCFVGIFVGMVLFGIQMPLFVGLVPAMFIYAVAYLLHLIDSARLSKYSTGLVALVLGTVAVYPLMSVVTLKPSTPPLKEASAIRSIGTQIPSNGMVFTDQPWAVAWYADRPAIWLPRSDGRVADLRKQFNEARWLFLSDGSRLYSDEWRYVYDAFRYWATLNYQHEHDGVAMAQSIRITGNQSPLITALDGFQSVMLPKSVTHTVVFAQVQAGGADEPPKPQSAGHKRAPSQ